MGRVEAEFRPARRTDLLRRGTRRPKHPKDVPQLFLHFPTVVIGRLAAGGCGSFAARGAMAIVAPGATSIRGGTTCQRSRTPRS